MSLSPKYRRQPRRYEIGLVGYWPLDEGTGTSAGDRSWVGNNTGTLVNTPTWVAGKFGNALSFARASSQYVNVGNSTVLRISGPITLAAWVKLASSQSEEGVIGRWKGTTQRNYVLVIIGTSPAIYVSPDGTDTNQVSANASAATTGVWHHIAGTYDNSNLKIYVDNALAATTAYSSGISTNDTVVVVGGEDVNSSLFDGTIDDARIYNRALSASEISELYNTTF